MTRQQTLTVEVDTYQEILEQQRAVHRACAVPDILDIAIYLHELYDRIAKMGGSDDYIARRKLLLAVRAKYHIVRERGWRRP